MSKEWKLVPVEPTKEMLEAGSREHARNPTNANPYHKYAAMIAAAPALPAFDEPEVVAVIAETDGVFPETDVIHRPGIDSLPVGTELVDRSHVTRLQAELAALKSKLGEAYEWGYGDGQNNPNGYSSEEDRDKCVADLTAALNPEPKAASHDE